MSASAMIRMESQARRSLDHHLDGSGTFLRFKTDLTHACCLPIQAYKQLRTFANRLDAEFRPLRETWIVRLMMSG